MQSRNSVNENQDPATESIESPLPAHQHDAQLCMFDASGDKVVWLCGHDPRVTAKA